MKEGVKLKNCRKSKNKKNSGLGRPDAQIRFGPDAGRARARGHSSSARQHRAVVPEGLHQLPAL